MTHITYAYDHQHNTIKLTVTNAVKFKVFSYYVRQSFNDL